MPQLEFFPETRSALLPIPEPKIVKALSARALADGFVPKGEFHVTFLPAIAADRIDPHEVEQYERMLRDQVITDLKVIENGVFHIQKPKVVEIENEQLTLERESIIAQVESKQLIALLSRFTTTYALFPPNVPLHTTLFTRGDNPFARRGIGVDSWNDLMGMNPVRYPLETVTED